LATEGSSRAGKDKQAEGRESHSVCWYERISLQDLNLEVMAMAVCDDDLYAFTWTHDGPYIVEQLR
jgi:hypothetical protein